MTFHIFIASCFEGLKIQVPRLIKNIIKSQIPVEYVHFIVGGCPSDLTYYDNGIEIVNVEYRCFEFTPLIYIVKNPDKYNFDFAFFTHDTVSFGNNFYKTIQNDILKLKETSFDTMKIDNKLISMNIGIYSKKIIFKNRDVLLNKLLLNTNNDDDLMNMKHLLVDYEDFILKQNNYNTNDASNSIEHEFKGHNGKKSKGSIKKFNRIDFIKYQSNYSAIQSIDICIINE